MDDLGADCRDAGGRDRALAREITEQRASFAESTGDTLRQRTFDDPPAMLTAAAGLRLRQIGVQLLDLLVVLLDGDHVAPVERIQRVEIRAVLSRRPIDLLEDVLLAL